LTSVKFLASIIALRAAGLQNTAARGALDTKKASGLLHKPLQKSKMALDGSLDDSQSSYGPGTRVDTNFTPVPEECRRLLRLFAEKTPGFTKNAALLNGVLFEGEDLPCIPGPIKSQAITAVLHAMVGIVGLEILHLRGLSTETTTYVNTDHAGLYPATPGLVKVDETTGPAVLNLPTVPQWDKDRQSNSPLVYRATAIYETADRGTWFQLHGSLDPWGLLRLIGISKDKDAEVRTNDAAYSLIQTHVRMYRAREIEQLMVEHGFSGSIVYSPKGWRDSEMGQRLGRHPLINYAKQTYCPTLPPAPLPTSEGRRPLEGIKVVELARIIAGTAAGALLASMGAEVIRVNSSKLKDYTPAQPSSLMAGKTTIDLDLNDPTDQARLLQLFEEADVILQGYRLRSLERRGFGLHAALEIANRRGKGIIYVDENCYGPDGCYAERPGWQQVADAAAGSSYVMAQSFGCPPGQGVLPSLPISDMSTGALTALTIMCAVRDRYVSGGSYHGHCALTAYDMATLDPEVRLYQRNVVQQVQEKYQFAPWSSDAHVAPLYYSIMDAWDRAGTFMKNEDFFVTFSDSVFGSKLRVLAPIVRYVDEESSPRWTSPPVPFCHHEFRSFSSN
jgi:crotonobetainyl-CoA:carnitine CoA-transferase CaiB-like acyl-CoA transferase